MEAGIKNEKSIVVTEDVTASKVGSGLLPVYATPSMIALMEGTCAESVQSELAEGEGTVGVSVDIKHIAATPIGMKVRCESLLKEVNGKKLVFEVNVYDEKGLIGTGTHKRAIINNDDSAVAANALTAGGFAVTKLSTTGGFLQVGNTTLLIGTEDDRVTELVGILKKYCATHKKVVPTTESFGRGLRKDGVAPEITVGGATYFVLDVADMGKL